MTEMDADPVIRQAIRSMPIPDHDAGFWERLEGRFDVVDRARGSVRAAADGGLITPDGAARRSAPAYAVTEASGRTWSSRVAGIAAAVVVLLAAALGAVRLIDDDPPAPVTASTTTTTVTVTNSADAAAIDVVDRFLAALGRGDTKAAASLLGPRSEAYLTATTGSVDGFLRDARDGYGAWAHVTDRTMTATPIRAGDEVVVVRGTQPGEGQPEVRADAFPVRHAESADAWFVEPWAFDADAGGRIELTSPDPSTSPPVLSADQPVTVAVPAAGTVWFAFDNGSATPVTPVVGANGRVATWHPELPAAGPQLLLAVFESDNGTTFTALARIVRVEGQAKSSG